MTWQKKARLAIGVFVIVFVAIVIVALRTRKTVPQTGTVPVRKDPIAIVENPTGGNFSWAKEGKIVFAIKFGSQFIYPDGRTKFGNGVELTSDRNGRKFTVTSREAVIVQNGLDLKTAHFTGAVKLTSAGVEVTAEEATYDEAEGIVKIPGAVAFKRGRMTGSGVGATYDRNREVLWLLDQAHITVAGGLEGPGGARGDRHRGGDGAGRALHAAHETRAHRGRRAGHRRRRDRHSPDRRQRARAEAGAARQQPHQGRRRGRSPCRRATSI